jgi:hypothetical protein
MANDELELSCIVVINTPQIQHKSHRAFILPVNIPNVIPIHTPIEIALIKYSCQFNPVRRTTSSCALSCGPMSCHETSVARLYKPMGIKLPYPPMEECAICLNPADRTTVCLRWCGHGFHSRCIETWLDENTTCPTCRDVVEPNVSVQIRCQGRPEAIYVDLVTYTMSFGLIEGGQRRWRPVPCVDILCDTILQYLGVGTYDIQEVHQIRDIVGNRSVIQSHDVHHLRDAVLFYTMRHRLTPRQSALLINKMKSRTDKLGIIDDQSHTYGTIDDIAWLGL